MLLNDEVKALIKNLHRFKECGFTEYTDEIFAAKLEKGRNGHFAKQNLGNKKHLLKARE